MSKLKRSPQVDKIDEELIIVERIVLDDDNVQGSKSPNCPILSETIN
jgi:hypothetical protein